MEYPALESFPTKSGTSQPRTAKSIELPHNFVPSSHSVICCQGKASSSSPGNKNLKWIIRSYFKPYSEARHKFEKTAIVSSIVACIKHAAPDGAFVKCEDGMWFEVEDSVAREKVGGMLRVSPQYRSRNKANKATRRIRVQSKVSADVSRLESCSHSSHSASIDLNTRNMLEPASFPLSFTRYKQEPEPEQRPSCHPFGQSLINSGARSSSIDSIFRDIIPMPAQFLEPPYFSSMQECSRITPRAPQQIFDALASLSDENDTDSMPDDISDIFD